MNSSAYCVWSLIFSFSAVACSSPVTDDVGSGGANSLGVGGSTSLTGSGGTAEVANQGDTGAGGLVGSGGQAPIETTGVGGEGAMGGSLSGGASSVGASGGVTSTGGVINTGGSGAGGAGTGGVANQTVGGICSSFANGSGTTQPCYIGVDGTAHCIADDGSTTALSNVPGTAINVTGRNFSTEACVVSEGGAVHCGQYGTETQWLSSGAIQVSGSLTGQCALLDGAVQCAGLVPENPTFPTGTPTQLTCSYHGCCAATDDGQMYCWGDVAAISGVNDSVTQLSLPDGKKVIGLGPGQDHICALLEGGQVQCWGPDWNLQVGGLGENRTVGNTLAESGAISVAAGQFHTCIAFEDGSVQCISQGQSEGAGLDMGALSQVSGIDNAVALNAGKHYTCALLADHTIKCWGRIGGGMTPIVIDGPKVAPCE